MNEKINFDSNKENSLLKRTNFFISVAYLCLQVLVPGALVFFLTSRDFSFSYHLPLWLMFIIAFSLVVYASLVTFITCKCKLHELDQFTYVLPFVGFIIGFYISSYWFDYNYFLVRFIIAFALAVLSLLGASSILLLVLKKTTREKTDNNE